MLFSVLQTSSSSITDEIHQEINEDDMPIYPPIQHSPHHSPHHVPYNSPGNSNHHPAGHQQNRPFSYTTQLAQLPPFHRQNEPYESSARHYSDSAYEPIPGDAEYAYTQMVTRRLNGHESPNNGNVQYRPEQYRHSDISAQPVLPARMQQTNRRPPPAPPTHPPPPIIHGRQSPKLPRQSLFQDMPLSPKSPVLKPKNFPNLKPTTVVSAPLPAVTSPVLKPLQKKMPTNVFPAPPPPVPVHVGMAAQMAQQRSPSPPLPPLPPELHHEQTVPVSHTPQQTQDIAPPPPPDVSSIPTRIQPKGGMERTDLITMQGGRSSPCREKQLPTMGTSNITDNGGLAAELAKVKLKKKGA